MTRWRPRGTDMRRSTGCQLVLTGSIGETTRHWLIDEKETPNFYEIMSQNQMCVGSGGRMRMIKRSVKWVWLLVMISGFARVACGAVPSVLYERGYNVMPEPQKVELKGGDFEFGSGWRLELGRGVKPDDVAVESLREGLEKRDGVTLETRGRGKAIELSISRGRSRSGKRQTKTNRRWRSRRTDWNWRTGGFGSPPTRRRGCLTGSIRWCNW